MRVDESFWRSDSSEIELFRDLEEEGFYFLWDRDFINLTIEDDGLEVHLIPIIARIGRFFQLYIGSIMRGEDFAKEGKIKSPAGAGQKWLNLLLLSSLFDYVFVANPPLLLLGYNHTSVDAHI